jgi:uncharacterized membrane protein YqhA
VAVLLPQDKQQVAVVLMVVMLALYPHFKRKLKTKMARGLSKDAKKS